MTGTDLCVNKSQFVLVIFEPLCSTVLRGLLLWALLERRKSGCVHERGIELDRMLVSECERAGRVSACDRRNANARMEEGNK